MITPLTMQCRPEDAIRDVLRTQWDGEPAIRLDSPPGAGKTYVVELLSVQSLALLHERCMVVTQTNEQAFELAYRLARGFPQHCFWLFTRKDLVLSPGLKALSNLRIIHEAASLPHQPCVVIANAAKWSWLPADVRLFDVQIIDEAFQLPDYRFYQIAGLAKRIVLVGDPGQIAPVVTCQVERWRGDPSGPHIACPHALMVRHPNVPHLPLPFSWRLIPDTVRFVQPAFYPKLPFAALSAPGERNLTLGAIGGSPLDQPIEFIPIMVYWASHARRHHRWPVYGSPMCRRALRSFWI